jgi:hypothetical protein
MSRQVELREVELTVNDSSTGVPVESGRVHERLTIDFASEPAFHPESCNWRA